MAADPSLATVQDGLTAAGPQDLWQDLPVVHLPAHPLPRPAPLSPSQRSAGLGPWGAGRGAWGSLGVLTLYIFTFTLTSPPPYLPPYS